MYDHSKFGMLRMSLAAVGAWAILFWTSMGSVYAQMDEGAGKDKAIGENEAAEKKEGAPSVKKEVGIVKKEVGIAPARASNTLDDVIGEIDPTKPDDLMFALTIYIRIEDHAKSKTLLKRLLELKLPANTLSSFQRRFGSGMFMQIARVPELQPEGARFGDSVLGATFSESRSPERLKALVMKLYEPSAASRGAAIEGLKKGELVAAQLLIRELANRPAPEQAFRLKQALTAFDETGVELLLAALASSDLATRIHITEILARIGAHRAVPFVIRAALDPTVDPAEREMAQVALVSMTGARPTRSEGLEVLRRRVTSYSGGTSLGATGLNNTVTAWQWNEKERTVQPRQLAAMDASAIIAARLAGDLSALDASKETERLYLQTGFEAAKGLASWGRDIPHDEGSIFAAAKKAGVEQVDLVLRTALNERRYGAALGAIEVLGYFPEREVLYSTDGRPRVLALALRDANRRIRFAAAVSILRLKPATAFPGCSHLAEVLASVAGTAGKRKILIGNPLSADGQGLVGLLAELGIQGEAYGTGRSLFERATRESDCEMIMVAEMLDRPNASETIQALRRDPRTAEIPIVLLGQSRDMDSVERIAGESEWVFPLRGATQSRLLAYQMRTISEQLGRRGVTREERLEQATQALEGLASLASDRKQFALYDLVRHERTIHAALYVPELTDKAARVLGMIATSHAQKALLELANQSMFSLAQRESAVAGFAMTIKQRGVLLTTREIQDQYDRYNRAARFEPAAQPLLEKLLDAIELPSQLESAQGR